MIRIWILSGDTVQNESFPLAVVEPLVEIGDTLGHDDPGPGILHALDVDCVHTPGKAQDDVRSELITMHPKSTKCRRHILKSAFLFSEIGIGLCCRARPDCVS